MIKFENTEVMGFEGAIRGMRNPLNSWDKSDSDYCYDYSDCEHCKLCDDKYAETTGENPYILGPNDLALAQKLIKAGSDHRKFLRQIFVSVDSTAPLYWWKEFDTYKVATVSNSCSTMHTIHKKEFTLDDFSHEHLFNGVERKEYYNDDMEYYENPTTCLEYTIAVLNYYRNKFIETKIKSMKEESKRAELRKRYWYQMIQLLPSSYNQKRTVTLNYETIRAIRHSDRKSHKLDEWRIDCMEWIDSLPYAEELLL